MSFKKTIKDIRAREEEIERKRQEREEANEKGKTRWFSLKDDGDTASLRFLQELDEDSPNYDPEKGLAFLAIEHVSPVPGKWHKRAVCSKDDEGRCVPCERRREAFEDGNKELGGQLGQKVRMYSNVLVDDGSEDSPYVAVFAANYTDKQIVPTVIAYAEEEPGSITNRWFKVRRNGKARDPKTSYTALGKDPSDLDTSGLELYDLDSIVRVVPYDEQVKFYELDELENSPREAPDTSSSSDDEDW